MIRFLQPEIGWWLLAGFAAIVLLKWRVRWRYAASSIVQALQGRRYSASYVRRLPFALLALALGLIGVALMQPVLPYSQADVSSRGLDIVLLLDLSSSMQEEIGLTLEQRVRTTTGPAGKTRLDATKDALKAFVRARRDDRIGLIVFSNYPYVVSPLTFDHEYVLRYIDFVDDKILEGEGQTAIGDGLALANYMLAKQYAGGARNQQVIVLFTDGEYNRGRDPIDVLAESRDANIRVHVIGVDLDQEVKEKPAVRELVATVERNGGRYFDADAERDLLAASRTVDSLEKSILVSRVFVQDVPVYQWFVVPALVCLAAAIGLRAVPYFVDQT
jgi:Ca-activated chloride channel family protein